MKKFVLVVVILILLVAGALVWFSLHHPAPTAAQLLPDTTLLFVDMPDFARTRADFQKTQLYQLWEEPEVQAFFEKPLTALREAVGENPAAPWAGLLDEQLLNLLRGETFVAVTHIAAFPSFQVGVVAGVDVKERQLLARGFLARAETNLRANNPSTTISTTDYLGIKYSLWQLRDNLQLCHAFLGSLVVFTLDENSMRDLISRHTGNAPADARPLAANPRYRDILRQQPANHELLAFLNIEQLLAIFGPLALAPQTAGLFQRFAGMDASAASVTLADGLIQDISLVRYAAGSHKPAPPVTLATLAATSPDTSLYSVRSLDLASAYRQSMDAIAQSGNARLVGPVSQFDRQLSQAGVRLADDILTNLGPELAVVATWRAGARLPEVALITELKNAAATRPKLDAAMNALRDALASGPWDDTTHAGETLRTIHIGDNTVSPTYVATDKFFILALTADNARSLVDQLRAGKSTLAASADYTKSMQRLPAKSTSYTYCDLRAVFTPLYASARANLPGAESPAFVSLNRLPATETIARHLGLFASATVDSDTGPTTTTFSPLGKPATMVLGLASALGAAQPWLAEVTPAVIPGLPKMSSGNPPAKSPTAPSQTPKP